MKSNLVVLSGIALLCLGAAVRLTPHDIITTKLTYTRDISPIFAHRCLACHAEKSSLSLASYEQVRPWAVGIKEQVLSRAMPPWGAVKGFGQFDPDGGLTQEEIMIVAAWVIGGAPKGNAMVPLSAASTALQKRSRPTGALSVSTGTVLTSQVRVVGIKPLVDGSIASARITATLPDGHVEPLIWLYRYDGRSQRTFQLRAPMDLPAGTVVESTAALQLQFETAKWSLPAR